MLTERNLKKSQTFGFEETLDHNKLRMFSIKSQMVLHQSASKIRKGDCTKEDVGCGLNDNCRFDEKCINDKYETKAIAAKKICHVDAMIIVDRMRRNA